MLTLARWACIPLSVIGGVVCFRWAAELYGQRAGLLSLGLWSLCPNILAHGQLITADVGAATLGVAAVYLFWKWCREPDWLRALTAGAGLGLAELTKSTWVLLFALYPVLWVSCQWPVLRRASGRCLCRLTGQCGLILITGLFVLNLGNGFEGSFRRVRDYEFVSGAFVGSHGRLERLAKPPAGPNTPTAFAVQGRLNDPTLWAEEPNNRFANAWFAGLPVPLPEDYLHGIDLQRVDFEANVPSYLRGEWRQNGWWYYYLYGLAIKVPLGTWCVALLATLGSF